VILQISRPIALDGSYVSAIPISPLDDISLDNAPIVLGWGSPNRVIIIVQIYLILISLINQLTLHHCWKIHHSRRFCKMWCTRRPCRLEAMIVVHRTVRCGSAVQWSALATVIIYLYKQHVPINRMFHVTYTITYRKLRRVLRRHWRPVGTITRWWFIATADWFSGCRHPVHVQRQLSRLSLRLHAPVRILRLDVGSCWRTADYTDNCISNRYAATTDNCISNRYAATTDNCISNRYAATTGRSTYVDASSSST